MKFIKSRCNRDNFWNLMFWVGMTIGSICTILLSLSEYNKLAFMGFWLTIVGVPYIVQKACKVSFSKDKNFLNSKGEILDTRIPNGFALAVTTAISVALLGLVIDSSFKDMSQFIATSMIFSLFFLIPTLYFILKNCPISIIFNKNIIKPMSAAELARFNAMSATSSSISSSSPSPDYICDPKYSFISSNIHNYHHYRR